MQWDGRVLGVDHNIVQLGDILTKSQKFILTNRYWNASPLVIYNRVMIQQMHTLTTNRHGEELDKKYWITFTAMVCSLQ